MGIKWVAIDYQPSHADILGRKVLDDSIHAGDIGIKMKFTAGATYVYHLPDGNQSLRSGKLMVAQ